MNIETEGIQLEKKTLDNKVYTQETSRPLGTVITFTSEGDDQSNWLSVGGGTALELTHNVGDPIEQSVVVDYNVKQNKTYVHEGYIMWEGASFDSICMAVIPKVTPTISGSGTTYQSYGGSLILPAAGTGDLTITGTPVLVEMPISRDTGVRRPAFWNADYDPDTNTYSNITPAIGPLGQPLGQYNMFYTDNPLVCWAMRVRLLDKGFLMLQTAESDELADGMRCKFVIHTHNTDHEWRASVILTLHRTRTC